MVTFRIDVDGETALHQTLVRFTENAGDISAPLDAMGDELARIERAEFSAQGKRNGKWAALSPAYAARKAREFPGAPILVRTGELRRSLTERPFGVDVIRRDSAIFGTDVPYARYHQDGTPFMPARPALVTKFDRGDAFTKILQRWIVEGVVRA